VEAAAEEAAAAEARATGMGQQAQAAEVHGADRTYSKPTTD